MLRYILQNKVDYFTIHRNKIEDILVDLTAFFGQQTITEQFGKLFRALYVQKSIGGLRVEAVWDNSKLLKK